MLDAPISDDLLRAVLDPVPERFDTAGGERPAAVLAPWFTRGGRDHLLYTLRRHDLPHHAGQISFPGGARDPGETPLACALRETDEELGIPADRISVLGALPPRTSSVGFRVQILVGRLPGTLDLSPDPSEVARVLSFPVDELIDRGRWREIPADRLARGGAGAAPDPRRRTPAFVRDGFTLWGLTARFTLDLMGRLRG